MADFFQRFTVGIASRIQGLQLQRKGIHHLLQLHNVTNRAQHLVKQRLPGNMDAILRQITDLSMLRQQHLPTVRLHYPHNTLHKGRLAGTVLPRECDALSAFDNEGERIKENAGTELDVQVLYGKNHYLPSLLFQREMLADCSAKRSAQSS